MPPFYRGVIYGMALFTLFFLAIVFGYSQGRASIIEQCIEHRAFTYGDGAWGCVRLRKSVREVERDEVITNQGVKT